MIFYIEQCIYILASLIIQTSYALCLQASPAGRYTPGVQATFILLPANVHDLTALTNLLSSQHFCHMQPLLHRPHGADFTWHHSAIAGHDYTGLWACSGSPNGSLGHSHSCPWFSAQCETKQRIPPPVRSLDHTLLPVLLGPTALQSFYCKDTFHFCSQPSLSLGLRLATTTPGRGQSEVNVPRSRTPSLGTWVCLAPSSFRVSSLLRGHAFHVQVEFGYFVWLFSKNGWSSINPCSWHNEHQWFSNFPTC